MPKYFVQRVCTYGIEIDAENGEEAVEIANGVPAEDARWERDWNDEYSFTNQDDDTDEGEVDA